MEAYTKVNKPLYLEASRISICPKVCSSFGKTGIMIPNPSTSIKMVIKIKPSAADCLDFAILMRNNHFAKRF